MGSHVQHAEDQPLSTGAEPAPPVEPLPGAVVYALDHRRVAEFYRAAIGLRESSCDDEHAVLESSQQRLIVLRIPEAIAAKITVQDPPERREDTAVKLLFVVHDIARARQQAAGLGGVIDPPDREWTFQGHTRCDGHDPEGNPLQVLSRDPHVLAPAPLAW